VPLGEVCNREVVIARRDETVLEAARLMRRYHVGDLVIVEERPQGRVPVGILTDRDLVVAVLACEEDPRTLSIDAVMTRDPLVAREEDGVARAVDLMRVKGVRRLPVVDARGVLIGIFTADDLIELLVEEMSAVPVLVKRGEVKERTRRP
jgi:CBS domain-containing protein